MAALKSGDSRRRPSPRRSSTTARSGPTQAASVEASRKRRQRGEPRVSPSAAQDSVVRELPAPKPAPSWIKFFVRVQQASSALTFLLIVAVLATYSWTVYAQQRWGHIYGNLEVLQRRERQLTTANEVLKSQMAQQAEDPKMGLVLPDLKSTIFLTPAPQRPAAKPEADALNPEPAPERPLGY